MLVRTTYLTNPPLLHPIMMMMMQDAQEYFSYLIDMLGRAEHAGSSRLSNNGSSAKLFEFGTETRIECMASHRVRRYMLFLSSRLPLRLLTF